MTPGELYDACSRASAGVPWYRRHPVLWLTSPYIQVGARTWKPKRAKDTADGTAWGYTGRQCRQVAAALLPVMEAHQELLERYVPGAAGFLPGVGNPGGTSTDQKGA